MNSPELSILVLYYSRHGSTRKLAELIAQGVESVPGCEARLRTVPAVSTVSEAVEPDIPNEGAPYVDRQDLQECAGLALGSPTRFGRMSSQMAAFWDTAGGLWYKGGLNGKVGAAFTSTATQHGGQETTLFSIITNLLHFGLVVVGLDYGYEGHTGVKEVHGTTPYGASTIADGDGSRQPSSVDLEGARYQGRRVAEVAAKLFG